MKKVVSITAALSFAFTFALILVYNQRATIAKTVMTRAVTATMSTNPIESLEDGLHISLCGAGGPMPDPNRSGSCVAIVAGKKLFVVDAGTNGVRNLGRLRYPTGDIEAVFLTHFHSDHIDGLGELATLRWVQGNNTEPLAVYGPDGVSKIVDGFNISYATDAIYRNDHHGDTVAPLSGHGMIARPFKVPADGQSTTIYAQDGITVQMIAVDHLPVAPAVAYIFSYRDRTVLISGDTEKSKNIGKYAKGIDLLVHEALSQNLVRIMKASATKAGNAPLAKIFTDILDYHTSPIEAAETARDAGVGHLLYYHIVPPLIFPGTEAAWLEGVDDVFNNYTVGIDGTSFSLPANSREIVKTRSSL